MRPNPAPSPLIRKRTGRLAGLRWITGVTLALAIMGSAWTSQAAEDAPEAAGVVEGKGIRVEYGRGERAFAEYLAETYPDVHSEITRRLGLAFEDPVEVSIHRTEEEFHAALSRWAPAGGGIGFEPWVAGVALLGRGRILIRSSAVAAGDRSGLDSVFAHEVAHLVLGRIIRADNGPQPVWLHEGLAQWATGRLVLGSRVQLSLAEGMCAIHPFARLEGGFPEDRWKAAIAYLQSESLVGFLAARHGEAAIRRILERMVAGSNFYRAFRAEAGVEFYEFEKEWVEYLRQVRILPWLLVSSGSFFTILTVIGGIALVLKRRRSREILDRWDREEALASPRRGGESTGWPPAGAGGARGSGDGG